MQLFFIKEHFLKEYIKNSPGAIKRIIKYCQWFLPRVYKSCIQNCFDRHLVQDGNLCDSIEL